MSRDTYPISIGEGRPSLSRLDANRIVESVQTVLHITHNPIIVKRHDHPDAFARGLVYVMVIDRYSQVLSLLDETQYPGWGPGSSRRTLNGTCIQFLSRYSRRDRKTVEQCVRQTMNRLDPESNIHFYRHWHDLAVRRLHRIRRWDMDYWYPNSLSWQVLDNDLQPPPMQFPGGTPHL